MLSASTPVTKEDLTAPATKADLMLLRTDLELVKADLKSVNTDLEGQIKLMKSDLGGQIKDVDRRIDVRTAEVKTSLTYMVWLAVATLGGAMALLRFF